MPAQLLGQLDPATHFPLPLFLESVQAGFPSPAQDYIEKTLDLNELCIRHPSATFLVRASGLSMIGVGIYPGDILVVDRSITAEHGHIVIACISGEMTVKELCTKPHYQLIPHNPDYQPIEIQDGIELDIFGVVTNVIKSMLNRYV